MGTAYIVNWSGRDGIWQEFRSRDTVGSRLEELFDEFEWSGYNTASGRLPGQWAAFVVSFTFEGDPDRPLRIRADVPDQGWDVFLGLFAGHDWLVITPGHQSGLSLQFGVRN
jgi:hypothetical protein